MSHEFPTHLIIPTGDILDNFKTDVELSLGFMLERIQIQEILTQVFEVLLNSNPEHRVADLQRLPKFNLIVGEERLTTQHRDMLKRCTAKMGMEVLSVVQPLNGYCDGYFPYVFERFLANDTVLTHMPY